MPRSRATSVIVDMSAGPASDSAARAASASAATVTRSSAGSGRAAIAAALALALSVRLAQQKFEHDEALSAAREALERERAVRETYENRVRELERWRFWSRRTTHAEAWEKDGAAATPTPSRGKTMV